MNILLVLTGGSRSTQSWGASKNSKYQLSIERNKIENLEWIKGKRINTHTQTYNNQMKWNTQADVTLEIQVFTRDFSAHTQFLFFFFFFLVSVSWFFMNPFFSFFFSFHFAWLLMFPFVLLFYFFHCQQCFCYLFLFCLFFK